jgi:hypothetical protein
LLDRSKEAAVGWGFNEFLMGFEVCSDFRVSAVLGTIFTFQVLYNVYIHANKEIDATKLYQLKYPRTIQDLCCEIP